MSIGWANALLEIEACKETYNKTKMEQQGAMNIGVDTDIFDETGTVPNEYNTFADRIELEYLKERAEQQQGEKRKRDPVEEEEEEEESSDESEDDTVQWLEHQDKLVYKTLKCPHCGEKHFQLVMRILHKQVCHYQCRTCYLTDFFI